MTLQEKAKELFSKHYHALNLVIDSSQDHHASAKQCALICVEEIIKEYGEYDEYFISICGDDFTGTIASAKRVEYWQQVKQEIEKL
jgi:hypothetical protein